MAGAALADVGGYTVASRIVNDVSYVTSINHESHFSWQVQYLVMFEGNVCCSTHCLLTFHVTRINHEITFSWQGQDLLEFKCDFSWQGQCLVKFGMIAGAQNVVFFNTKCSWSARRVTSVARRVAG